MKFFHYSDITKLLASMGAFGVLTLCFINPEWTLAAIFTLPFLILFGLWTILDAATVTRDGNVIKI